MKPKNMISMEDWTRNKTHHSNQEDFTMKYLVTGATGHLGKLVVKFLLLQMAPAELAVSVRNPEKAADLAKLGVDVRKGDFDDVESLKTAFHDVERLLIISTDGDADSRIRQHLNAVKAAKEAGVKFIAYTSVADARKSELFLAVVHKTTEEAIEASGIPYAFLRNNWYLGNERSTIQAVMNGAPWITSAGDGKVGWATREEYAEAAANVMLDDSIRNEVFELSGKPMTQAQLASMVGEQLGKQVEVKQVSDQEYVDIMKAAGVPDFMLPMVLSIQQGIRKGTLDILSNDFERVLKRPLKPLNEALKAFI